MSWLQNTLAAFPGTVVAVTHDRYFLDSVAGWILELDQGKGTPPLALNPPLSPRLLTHSFLRVPSISFRGAQVSNLVRRAVEG